MQKNKGNWGFMRDSLDNLKAELLGKTGGAKEEGGAETGGKDPKDPNVEGGGLDVVKALQGQWGVCGQDSKGAGGPAHGAEATHQDTVLKEQGQVGMRGIPALRDCVPGAGMEGGKHHRPGGRGTQLIHELDFMASGMWLRRRQAGLAEGQRGSGGRDHPTQLRPLKSRGLGQQGTAEEEQE